MNNLKNTNPKTPKNICMQEPITEKKKQRRGKGFALRICKLYYQTKKNKDNYKRSILIKED